MKRFMFVTAVMTAIMLAAGVGLAVDLSYGVKGGVGLAKYVGDDTTGDDKSRIGYIAGLFVSISPVKLIALQPEALFSMKGEKFKESGVDGSITDSMGYIEVPVLLKIYPPIPLPVKLNVFVGPYAAFNVIAKYKATGDYANLFEFLLIPTKDDYDNEDITDLDFGLVFGAGVDIGKFLIDGRYSLGLRTTDSSGLDLEYKNSMLSVMAGFKLK